MEGRIIDRTSGPEWTAQLPGFVNGHRYASVPIEEALVEVHCAQPEQFDVRRLGALFGASDGFPKAEEQVEVSGGVGVEEDRVESDFHKNVVGYRFRRSDDQRAIQVQPNRLVFNWLRPYESWDALLGEFEPVWERYAKVAEPTPVVAGVRYINIIRVPKPQVEIGDYLRISIDVPPYLPQSVASHFLQVEIPFGDGTTSRIVSSLVDSGEPGKQALLLDIGVQQRLHGHGDEVLRESLDRLRVVKNYVFEACITDATRGLMDDGTC
ncbi:TIGR04255 family protein [Actinotalea sp. M2MS4P-6]|uniref:TIGR04255 family protein n=1 Tax=Actinotalea sp. M2MS4P-6 TaxID=2983762 RepID=UPI0021E35DEC|nr:TIGR04255 family protein [Actinotalea sp. M2MS4P-6]MCV2392973.1 TIGR04255 family protein [Actinotalea sp. M2MS4P-6]